MCMTLRICILDYTGRADFFIQAKQAFEPDFQTHPESNYSIIISTTAYIHSFCFFSNFFQIQQPFYFRKQILLYIFNLYIYIPFFVFSNFFQNQQPIFDFPKQKRACRFFQETLVPQPGLVRLRAPAPAALGGATGFHVVAAK